MSSDQAGPSNDELRDLIRRQQEQIAELQAQVAQLQTPRIPNGAERETEAAPGGRLPLAWRALLIAGIALICGLILIIASYRPNTSASVGRASDFPPGTITFVQAAAPSPGAEGIPVYVVHDPDRGFLALYARGPGSNCLLGWNAVTGQMEDPCNRSQFTRAGDYLAGPAPRGLDRFRVVVDENGDVTIDVGTLLPGPGR